MLYNELASAAIDQERMMKAVAEADDKKRQRMMSRAASSGSSSGAPPKYRMEYTPPGVSYVDHNSSRIGALAHNSNHDNSSSNSSSTVPLLHHRSKLPSGHHSSFPSATFHASTVGRWVTLLENAANPRKATHREPRHLWSISRGAIRRVLQHGQDAPTTPPWRRFPWEKKC
jgi:hypothetical protein